MSNIVDLGVGSPRAQRLSVAIMDAVEAELKVADMSLVEITRVLEGIKSHYLIQSWLDMHLEDD